MNKKIIIALALIALALAGFWYTTRNADKNGNENGYNPPAENPSMNPPQSPPPSGSAAPVAQAAYDCDGQKTIKAAFYKGDTQPIEPGQPPIPSGSVKLELSDGRKFELAQTISADGGRYANTDESFIFWDKGESALILENNAERDYKNCVISKDNAQTQSNAADTGWQIYSNSKFGYSISYPANWTFREYPSTLTGAGFRPKASPNDVASECITVDARGTAEIEYNTPLADYAKKAAIVEIEAFEKLDSISPVATASGITGYKTTWIYRGIRDKGQISLPIAYFENKKSIQTENGQLKFKTVQIALNDEKCREVYDKMLPTFNLEK